MLNNSILLLDISLKLYRKSYVNLVSRVELLASTPDIRSVAWQRRKEDIIIYWYTGQLIDQHMSSVFSKDLLILVHKVHTELTI